MSQHHHHHHEPGNHAACIRLVPIFNHLENDAMDKIAERATTKVFKRSDYLFRAQEKDDTLYIVNRGKVRIFLLSESGKEQLIRILHPGDFMGEWTIFNPGGVHEAYAQATQDTVVLYDWSSRYPSVLNGLPNHNNETTRRNVATA